MAATNTLSKGPSAALPEADKYFSYGLAQTDEDLEAAYRIRYQVYCLERGFLEPERYPSQCEQDEYDSRSLHFLARHKTGEPAGTARLVLHSDLGFPLQTHCDISTGCECLHDPASPQSRCYGEISRLAVSKVFRRRKGDTVYGGPPRPSASRIGGGEVIRLPTAREAPEIVSGIYRVLYHESRRRGIQHWVVAMERGLHIILRRMGFTFAPVGPKVDYFGPVRPYAASIASFERHLFNTAPELLRYMLTGLERELWPEYARFDDGADAAAAAG